LKIAEKEGKNGPRMGRLLKKIYFRAENRAKNRAENRAEKRTTEAANMCAGVPCSTLSL